ncbi:VOC family protein [Escherichia coli]|nr:VOC family protein [Escherichia coli]
MAKMIHSMIRVLDEQQSVDFYHQAFGLNIVRRFDFPDFSLIYLANDETPFELELTVNHGRDTSYDRGNGYGHLAFSVADLDAEHARLTELGFNPRKLVEFAPEGQFVGRFFFISDPDGYDIEVLQRGGVYL